MNQNLKKETIFIFDELAPYTNWLVVGLFLKKC